MSNLKHIIKLNLSERADLQKIIDDPTSPEKHVTRAKILLASDMDGGQRKTIDKMVEEFHTTGPTINLTRKNYLRFGMEVAVKGRRRETPPIKPKVTNKIEAKILRLLWSPPPSGKKKWTLISLANKVQEEGILDSISKSKIAQILKKYGLSTKV